MMEENEISKDESGYVSEEQFVERVENAAREGAKKGARGRGFLGKIPVFNILVIVLIIGAIFFVKNSIEHSWTNFADDLMAQFTIGESAESHDLVLENHGIFGFTVADFADAILGDSSQLKKLEVYEQEVADVATITKAGIGNVKIFEKNQMVTYHGTAIYTVDLSKLSRGDISLDEDKMVITMKIPHAEMEKINIPEDKMEFGDVSKGWLAFGDITLTPEEHSKIQSAARKKMEEKLVEMEASEQADRFAKMSVWEVYQSVVNGVSPAYTLEVEFK